MKTAVAATALNARHYGANCPKAVKGSYIVTRRGDVTCKACLKRMVGPAESYTLGDGRVLTAVKEPVPGLSEMVFIKEGEAYVPLDEMARLGFYSDDIRAWLKAWGY